jgi:hypothetical protein
MARPTNRETAGLVAGFALWSLAFVALYGGHGLACGMEVQPGAGSSLTRWLLVGAWIVFIIAHVVLILWLARRLRGAEGSVRFIRRVSLVLALGALGATVWTGLPVVTLSIC